MLLPFRRKTEFSTENEQSFNVILLALGRLFYSTDLLSLQVATPSEVNLGDVISSLTWLLVDF
jgi:hypothetical protein